MKKIAILGSTGSIGTQTLEVVQNNDDLQVVLRRMINQATSNEVSADDVIPPETIRMAAVVVATAPVVIIYPFIQKYFTKGTLAGAVKG